MCFIRSLYVCISVWCVCVYICVCVYMCVWCVRVCGVCVCTYVCVWCVHTVYVCVCTYVCGVCICVHVCVWCVHVRARVCACTLPLLLALHNKFLVRTF